jgi:hypothetical protein
MSEDRYVNEAVAFEMDGWMDVSPFLVLAV